jgi:hypothetical protein
MQKATPPCLSAVVPGMWDEGGKGRKIVAAELSENRNFTATRLDERYVWDQYACCPFRAGRDRNGHQGLKPPAESCHPFGIRPTAPSGTKADSTLRDELATHPATGGRPLSIPTRYAGAIPGRRF